MTRRSLARAAATEADPRWAAVASRDASADGAWVYSVGTTGVYCRPSCGARTPLAENVTFHLTAAEAAAAGYRPCMRCAPDGDSPAVRKAAIVADLVRFIERAEEVPRLAALARHAGLSESYTHRLFRAATGLTPRQYALQVRAHRAREALAEAATITDAVYAAGFSSGSGFYARTDRILGMKPTAYRAGGVGERIVFAVGETSLGPILAASTARGVCAILLGDEPEALVHDLERRFPNAELVGGDADFERTVALVVGLVEHPAAGLELPLDVRGTAFQQRVWAALRDIPAGETSSYAQVAARIGAPHATRAVAGACAANSLAVAIPCHRVVRTDGSLSGYRWGVERKRVLLEREATLA